MKNDLMINKRNEKGFQKGCLAALTHTTVKNIHEIEQGRMIPDIHLAFKISWHLDTKLEELFPIYTPDYEDMTILF